MTDTNCGVGPRGIVMPLHTPFDEAGRLDCEGVRAEIRRAEDLGVTWLLLAGSTGEWHALTVDERRTLVECACQTKTRAKILVHVQAMNLATTIDLVTHAESTGADAVMVSAPIACVVTESEAVAHITRLASETSLPVAIYNGAAGTSRPLSPGALARTCAVSNLVAVKDSSRDARAFLETRALVDGRLAILCGEGDLLPAWLGMGADGGIVLPALVDTERTLAYYEAFARGEMETASRLWADIWSLIAAASVTGRVLPTLKLALGLAGRPAGRCRPPQAGEADTEAATAIRGAMARLDLLSSRPMPHLSREDTGGRQ